MAAVDPRERAADLLNRMLNDIERQLRDASADRRAALILKFGPMLEKQVRDAEVDDAYEKVREELDEMRVEIRDALLNRAPASAPAPLQQPPRDA